MGQWTDYGKAVAKHYEQNAATIGARRYAMEEEMPAHMITFGPVGPWEEGQDTHIFGDKLQTVIDMACPCCDAKLYVYYRIVPPSGIINEDKSERNEK